MIAEIPESITRAELDLSSPIKHFAMAEPETPLTPPASDGDSYEGSDISDEPQEPRLTPDEPRALLIGFYTFLTTLHYDKSYLKIPPQTGWPELTPDSCAHFKSDYAIQVIRHLPHFDNTCIEYVHYKSKLLDLIAFTLDDFEKHKNYHKDWGFWSSEGEQMDPSDVVCIAVGHESLSRELWLNVKDCEIFEDFLAGDMLDVIPVEQFFDYLKEQYETLKLIPGRRQVTIEVEKVPEHGGRITEEEVTNQTEEWGTDLDVQYVRQIYRDHGWPGSFDMETAPEAIDKWLEPLGGGEGGEAKGACVAAKSFRLGRNLVDIDS
ncbi:uncharacterized protein FFUJ_14584 [Fusarium fujikuroi IMI 58289]|uniref:Uncharacterized protein n=1 Tax=Gibberella fujikuroi (strain CBS 195.34 / IMI 58289 / NRRL A-6831) TaxID=1279085 RepID=S0E5H0_GIBF5|nr:uncharacterized protein FFUJ_14584 [Fusarium fujikuroi IMI 58289]KLP06051.1 uncharacterized protein LW94_7378 [Fusarium fujikuroi]CCT67848.1 uncharacterized protein FFUJ_14584 [Fusarium fujikuroi IMI 58289]SCO21660.1 uncharacterized protein FFM5_12716 [Fusarium fujikuroi]SCO41921.1 uncharacterized protein FFMR_06584 [Fusarium fujikuroi]